MISKKHSNNNDSIIEKLIGLIKKYSTIRKVDNSSDLEWDYGITGDDAFEFIVEYGKTFSVDVSQFPFHDYFYDEGQNIIFLFKRIFKGYKKKKISIDKLLVGIEEGKLV
jgi:hypothetical protein